ncbi:MAG: hypothetical protein RL885_15250 [Planctomycetota bacterium]
MKRTMTFLMMMALMFGGTAALTGCDGDLEDAAEDVEDAAEDAGDEIEDAVDK